MLSFYTIDSETSGIHTYVCSHTHLQLDWICAKQSNLVSFLLLLLIDSHHGSYCVTLESNNNEDNNTAIFYILAVSKHLCECQ